MRIFVSKLALLLPTYGNAPVPVYVGDITP